MINLIIQKKKVNTRSFNTQNNNFNSAYNNGWRPKICKAGFGTNKANKIKKDVLRKKMADMMAGGVNSKAGGLYLPVADLSSRPAKKANVGPNLLSFASSQLKCVRFTSLGLVLALC